MSRSRARKKQSQLVQLVPAGGKQQPQDDEPSSYQRGYGSVESRPPVLIPLDEEITPILEANRATRNARTRRAQNGMRSISQAWDDTEALGITADMRRSGPGMLSDQDRKDTLYKAYLNSVWISACVDVISKRITSGGYTIEYCGTNETPTPEEEAQKEVLQAFIDYTNDDEDFLQLVRTIVTDILIYGECFVEVVKQNGVPYSLHKIDCITMNYSLDQHGNIVKYIQNLYHSTETIPFEPDEVIRFWLPSPNANKIALSPIERIMGSIDADVHMSDWVRSFFRKGARPNFWVKFPGPKEEADRFVVWLRENYTGMANAHVPLVLYDEAELYEIGKGSVDVDFLKGRELMCKEILAGYQVPPALVGLIESGNIGGGTGESQEKSFLRNACDPVRAMIFAQINYRVTQQGFNIKCWKLGSRYADFRDDTIISEIQDRRIRNGSLNINETRREMNRPSVDGGDTNVIVTTREVTAVSRLDELEDEQRETTAAATAHTQAQTALTQAQADKLKEPPPEPTPPPAQPPAGPTPGEQAAAQERVLLRYQISRLIESLEQHRHTEDVRHDAAQLLAQMLSESRPVTSDEVSPRIAEALASLDEQLREIRAKDATPRKRAPRRKSVVPAPEQPQETLDQLIEEAKQEIVEQDQQHTGVMVAFMLDPETAAQLAVPGGEPENDLHITLAYLGDMEDAALDLPAHLSELQQALRAYAIDRSPLQGKIAGLGRFKAPEGELMPVIALPDIPDLPFLRQDLVSMLAQVGCPANSEHGYTPHITLAYIDASAPMPIESIPELPLLFNAICLAVGDERYYYPFGGPYESKPQSDPEDLPQHESGGEREAPGLSQRDTGEAAPDPASDSEDGRKQSTELTDELARWRERAIEDARVLGQHPVFRGFTTTIIPEPLHTAISDALKECRDPNDVAGVFERAYWGELPSESEPPADEHLEESTVPTDKGALQKRIHELFSGVAERGHKAMSEESAE